MQSFPKPLSTTEEQEYLERLKTGDPQARDCLIQRNLRLVAYIAKKYQSLEVDMEDLISIGTIGLIKGIDSFDETKKIRLATYASRCIENEILMFVRSSKKSSRDVYLYDTIGTDKEGGEISLIDVMEYEDEDVVERVTKERYIDKLAGYMEQVLGDREREILVLRFGLNGGDEMTQKEVGEMFGISRSYVSRIEKRALEKLRKKYQQEYGEVL